MFGFGKPNVEKMERKKDVEGLIKLLNYEKDVQVRQSVMRALGNIRDQRAVEPIIKGLSDSNIYIRKEAAVALGNIGDQRGIEPLIKTLREDSYKVSEVAAEALAKIGKPVVDFLIKTLDDSDRPIRRTAAFSLEKIGWRPSEDEVSIQYWISKEEWNKCVEIGTPAVEPLIKVLSDSDKNIRIRATWALGEIGDQCAAKPLIKVLSEADKEVRGGAAEALRKIGWKPGKDEISAQYWISKEEWDKCVEVGTPAIEPLVKTLNDLDKDVRWMTVLSLGKIGDQRAVKPLIKALNDSDIHVRMGTAEVLGKIGDKHAVESLIKTLNDSSWSVRKNATWALGNIGDQSAVEPLIKALSDSELDVRMGAAEALGKIGDKRAIESLIKSLSDSDIDFRRIVAEALGKIGDKRAIEPLILALNDSDINVRGRAAEALVRVGTPAVEPLINALLSDSDSWVRLEAAETLVKIGDQRAVELLIKALSDSSWHIRERAAEALGKIGDQRAVEPLIKALSDSSDSVRGIVSEALGKIGWEPEKDELVIQYWIAEHEWNKCVEIGIPAVEPLIKVLCDSNKVIRVKAAETLGLIKDQRAIEPLIRTLNNPDRYFCKTVVKALENIGWEPGKDEASAQYWVIKGIWDKCVEIGTPAVEPLIKVLNDSDMDVRRAAVETLGEIGDKRAVEPLLKALSDNNKLVIACTPKEDYGVHKVEAPPDFLGSSLVTALGKMGDTRVIEPLICILKNSGCGKTRRAAASSLLNLFKDGRIDQNAKTSIFSTKALMTSPHQDGMISTGSSSDCRSYHKDTGVGIDFLI